MTIGHLTGAGECLVEAVRRADLDATVPGLEWTVREVAVHTGAVHRWATDVVRRRLPDRAGGSTAFRPDSLDDDALASWLADGLGALCEELDAAPADLDCFTFVPGSVPRAFWIRRQLHETTIHRVDVEAGSGAAITPVGADVANDGLAELIGGFATEPGLAIGTPATLALAPTDGPWWRIVLGGAQTVTGSGDRSAPSADAVIRGTADQLYRWAWNRPSEVAIDGDREAARLWSSVRI